VIDRDGQGQKCAGTLHAKQPVKPPAVPSFASKPRPTARGSSSLLCYSYKKHARKPDASHGWHSVLRFGRIGVAGKLCAPSCVPLDENNGGSDGCDSESVSTVADTRVMPGFLTPAHTIPISSAVISYTHARKLAELAAARLMVTSAIDQPSPSTVTCPWDAPLLRSTPTPPPTPLPQDVDVCDVEARRPVYQEVGSSSQSQPSCITASWS
jgi:hypothetical protein